MDQSGCRTEGGKGAVKGKGKGKIVVEQKEECGECKKEVKSQDQGVACDLCGVWFHDKCGNISQELYQCLMSDSKDKKGTGLHWFCVDCNRVAKKILTSLGGLQERQDELEGELVKVRKEINTMSKVLEGNQKIIEELRKTVDKTYAEVLEGVKQDVKEIKGDLQTVQGRSYADSLITGKGQEVDGVKPQDNKQRRNMQEQVFEAMEREKRRLNIVIMGVKEGTEDKDKEMVMELMKVLGLEDADEVQVMGRIGKVGVKPRLIRIKLVNWENRRKVMLRAKQLKDSLGFEHVYICPDLTRKQQEEDKKLRDQVKEFRGKGKHDRVKISRGQVVGYVGGKKEVLYNSIE